MEHKLVNPIIPGFNPDPSICKVGDDFYIACSSFELCPGVPIYHSKDLANWELISYAVTAENGFHVEKNGLHGGVMAPTLRYHNGTYYIINANFADAGNYIVTATNPAGPWSAPRFLDDVPGIDASMFFDDDGQCYIMGTGDVWDNGCGGKERGIWIAKYDIDNFKVVSEPVCIYNSALRVGTSPEAPHIYHVGDYYYLIIAEGGTEHYHAVMVARSKELFGFYEGNPANPVLTHRHLGFAADVANIGHADLVQLDDGSWYAVMLGSRQIERKYKNLGRETFICPVIWERDWPVFAPETGKVENEYPAPASLPWTPFKSDEGFDDFNSQELSEKWAFIGTPYEKFYDIADSKLHIKCIKTKLNEDIRQAGWIPQYLKDTFLPMLCQKQTAINQVASCRISFDPKGNESAGLAVVQAMNHLYMMEIALENGERVFRVKRSYCKFEIPTYFPGFTSETCEDIVASKKIDYTDAVIKLEMEGEKFDIYVGASENNLELVTTVDGGFINPEKVGGMVGTMIGVYATGNGENIENEAAFDWFKLV